MLRFMGSKRVGHDRVTTDLPLNAAKLPTGNTVALRVPLI